MVDIGDVLERHELIGRLGKPGAFGVVFRARHLDTGREDAVKVPHDPRWASLFTREARLVAGLDHPNIVRILHMNAQHDPPYIVFELVDGMSLRERLEQAGGTLPPDEVVEIARQVLEGLAVAHEAGVIHRDLKPENILIRRDGVVKIADFGLGLATMQAGMSASFTRQSTLDDSRDFSEDVESSIAGTLAYMSPEQRAGREVDARSDLHSLGRVMYEMLTGGLPEFGSPTPKQANSAVSDELDEAICRALRATPEDRFADSRAMLRAMGVGGVVAARPLICQPRQHSQVVRRNASSPVPGPSEPGRGISTVQGERPTTRSHRNSLRRLLIRLRELDDLPRRIKQRATRTHRDGLVSLRCSLDSVLGCAVRRATAVGAYIGWKALAIAVPVASFAALNGNNLDEMIYSLVTGTGPWGVYGFRVLGWAAAQCTADRIALGRDALDGISGGPTKGRRAAMLLLAAVSFGAGHFWRLLFW